MLTKIKPKINYRKNYQNKSFKGKDLSKADFSNCDIRGADFTNANLTGANFTNATAGLANRRAILIFIVGAIASIIATIGTSIATYYLIRFISLSPGYKMPFSGGLVLLFLLLLTELTILTMVKRQGIQKAL
ncbi:MAG: pentapeptide repeat-containing protein, partial [Cyanobacteriota bacterium]|nr:pentapeptide repeat-containing protein [Cyanobacteriota bacterium]